MDWLLKTIDDTALENYKNRLREDIHTGANVPHMCDESFGGNLSGVAISYKLWGLEQICSIKERKFKKGLQRRIELITIMITETLFQNSAGTVLRMIWKQHRLSRCWQMTFQGRPDCS